MPAERQVGAEVEAAPGLGRAAGEAVEDRVLRARPRRRGWRTCRPTPRGCGSRAPGRGRGPGRSGRRRPAAARRGASGRSGSRARTRPRPRPSGWSSSASSDVDALRGVVGVDPDGGPHVVVGGGDGRWPAGESAASVPTVTNGVDPGRRAAAASDLVGVIAEVAVAVGPGATAHRTVQRRRSGAPPSGLAGEERGALLDGEAARVAAPGRRRRAGAGRSTRPLEPDAPPDLLAPPSGTAGEARMATMRSASRASPSTASTSGPGSAFQGSLASRWALVARGRAARWPPAPSEGWTAAQAAAASA